MVVAGANVHDTKLLALTLESVVVERPRGDDNRPQQEIGQHLRFNCKRDRALRLDREWRRRETIPIVVLYKFSGCLCIIKPDEEATSRLTRFRRLRPVYYEYGQRRYSHSNAIDRNGIKITSSNLTDRASFTSYPQTVKKVPVRDCLMALC